MYIQTDLLIDFTTDDIFNFAIDTAATRYSSPWVVPAGFAEPTASRGFPLMPNDPEAFAIPYAETRTYAVRRGKQFVGQVSIHVFHVQYVKLTVDYHLLIKIGVPSDIERRIVDAFSTYDPEVEDPYACVARHLGSGIEPAMFSVEASYTLTKDHRRTEDHQEKQLIGLLEPGNPNGLQITGTLFGDVTESGQDVDLNSYYLNDAEPFSHELVSVIPIKGPIALQADSVNEVPVSDIVDVVDVERVARLAAGRSECADRDISVESIRIFRVLAWLDFKIDWEPFLIETGPRKCRIKIKLYRPVVYVMRTYKELWAYISIPAQSVEPALVQWVRECALEAALLGAVMGVVLFSFPAAVAAFKSAFELCLKRKARSYVECLLPGLMMKHSNDGWSRL